MATTKQTKQTKSGAERLRDAIARKCNGDIRVAAEKCNINYTVFSQIQKGTRAPGKSHRTRIREGLGVPINAWPTDGLL